MKLNKTIDVRSKDTIQYISPLAAWALAFGCSVGWGAFVMPGTTFLPVAGPLGAALGLLIGAGIMVLFGISYCYLMQRYPDRGGAYTYARKVLGSDHGFLCGWMLFLTYIAIIWANSTALSLIMRYTFGDVFCFGFSYELVGYTVYMGEVLLSVAVIALTCGVCMIGKRFMARFQMICALLLICGVTACFVAAVIHTGGLSGMKPLFSGGSDPAVQVLGIVVLAPWAFVGFESISHSVPDFNFPVKRSLSVMVGALVTGLSAYVMLTFCAALAVPDGFSNWTEYISSLFTLDGITAVPTFYSAKASLGTTGLRLLVISAVCGIATGLVANFVALSGLLLNLSKQGMPAALGKKNSRGVPYVALLSVAGLSVIMPFFGRTAIGWIVDITTIGASIVYAYVSIAAFVVGRREQNYKVQAVGAVGAVVALAFSVVYLLPVFRHSQLAAPDYLILVLWSVLGMFVFRLILHRDKSHTHGKSEIVWIVLIVMILMISGIWIWQTSLAEAEQIAAELGSSDIGGAQEYLSGRIFGYHEMVVKNVIIMSVLMLIAVSLIFSIFSVYKKHEKEMESARLAAEENSRAKSAFLSNMSHDIRTPMNAVTGYTTLALQETDISDKLRGYLEKIDVSGKHMLSIINDILDMSRIESGKTELDTAPEDIVKMLDEVESIFHHQMKGKKIDFTVDCTEVRDRYVICDKQRMNRILLNLISNAYKFTPKGGSVRVKLRQTGSENGIYSYIFSVADTGIGMSPEFAEKIFDAFERERDETVDKIQGTGLGMSITKKLVELMGGEIRVITEKGKGTEFIIRLSFPAASDEDIHILSEIGTVDSAKRYFSGVTLLLVEDNPINCEIAKAILENEGFTIETAQDGKQGLEAVKAADPGHFDAVLMDIQMPVMNGYDAARAIKALPSPRCDVPVIAMTANTFGEDIRKAREAGMPAHIAKPIEVDDMLTKIAEVLDSAADQNSI